MTLRLVSIALATALVTAMPAAAREKLGPNATTILESNEYLRDAPAPDYWAMAPFYVPQETSSACSLAAITIALNTLRGLPEWNNEAVLTQSDLLDIVGDETWREQTAVDGPGVLFSEFVAYTRGALAATGFGSARVTAKQPATADAEALAAFRAALAENEASADSVMIVAYSQGMVTGDWFGPHASPIAAYDAANDRVLIMDVDRQWYVPYWTGTATLLAAMTKPAPPEMGRLAGDRGGWILIRR